MAELFEEVVALLESRSATRALAGKFRIESQQSAGNGAVLAVPIFLAVMSDWATDDDRCGALSKILRSMDTGGLQDPGAAIEGRRHEPVGSELTNLLLADRRPAVASLISSEAGITKAAANGLLPPTAWAVMASLADRYGNRIDRQSLIAILAREHQDLVGAGWGPWLEASGQSDPGIMLVDDSRSGFEPDEDPAFDIGAVFDPGDVYSTVDRFSPAEGLNTADRFSPAEGLNTADRFSPAEGLNTADRFGPAEGLNTADRFGPAEGLNTADRFDPTGGTEAPDVVNTGDWFSPVQAADPVETYPPPVTRGARLTQERSPSAAVLGRQATTLSEPGVASPARPSALEGDAPDGAMSRFQTDPYQADPYESEPFEDEDLVPNRIPAILIALVVFLVGAAIAYLVLNDRNEETTGVTDDSTSAETDDTQSDDAEQGTEEPSSPNVVDDDVAGEESAEMTAIDVMMSDPLGRSTATGVAELRFDDVAGEICYNFTAEQIESPFEGHIHVGPPGVKGGIVVDFGMLNNTDIGCTPVSQNEISVILADLPGHYVELHDPNEAFTIRAQLSEAMPDDTDGSGSGDGLYDPTGGGALTRVESGRLVLVGEVADQETFDRLAGEYADLIGPGLELVNELTIVEGAPLPSGTIAIDDSVLFAIGSDQLAADRGTVITDLATLLKARPDWVITIVGHTDSTGSEVINLALSLRRAEAVRDELIGNGVATETLLVKGAGSTAPIADNETAEGRARNRRIEINVDRG